MLLNRSAFFRTVLSTLLALLPSAVRTPAQEQTASARPIRVLFVGNSYTYFNNLPEIFFRLAVAGGQSKVEYRMEAPGGWRLRDHWEKGESLKALHDSHWDYVVLQEQSTLAMNYFVEGKPRVGGDAFFKPYALKWAAEVRKAGATAVFYLTWARKATPEDQGALNFAYTQAAKEGKAQIAPVGIAWAQVREQHPSVELYYSDGSHPSPAGSYLAACTLYSTIFNRSPAGLPGRISGVPVNLSTAKAEPEKNAVLVELERDQAGQLQAAAWGAHKKLEASGGYLSVVAPPVPGLAPLPQGERLSASTLEGQWRGSLVLYPSPPQPAEMLLRLRRDGASWSGQLELNFHSKDQPSQSMGLTDLNVSERELNFSDPRAPQNLAIHFRGVSPQGDRLVGIAEAAAGNPEASIRLLGTWQLQRK